VTQVVREIEEVRGAVTGAREKNLKVGLVPTMGALHAGHIALIQAARRESAYVIVSVFVNPTQFGPHEDFSRYPRPFEADLGICRAEGVDLVFAPPPEVVYPEGFSTLVEVQGLQNVLEGASRPGHFRGVCTVVLKLFNMVSPDMAWFGQKDAQQVIVLKQMVRDLNMPVELYVCPIVRESDGLALSSRNVYLTPEQRSQAVALSQALAAARKRIESGERSGEAIQKFLAERVRATTGASLDYAAVVSARTLAPSQRLEGTVLLALAVRFGATRLIDNLVLLVNEECVSETGL
jgi:pantoate--beta-alanine ligase